MTVKISQTADVQRFFEEASGQLNERGDPRTKALVRRILDELGDVQLLGGAGEVEGPGQRLEVAQVTKLHDTSRVWFERKMILDPSEEGDGCLAETTAKPARYRASLERRTVENPTATLVDPRE